MTGLLEPPGAMAPVASGVARPADRRPPATGPADAERARAHPTHPGPLPADARPGGPHAPWSPCRPSSCLPDPPVGGRFRAARRAVALVVLLAAAVVAGAVLPLVGPRTRDRLLHRLLGAALRAAGVRLEVSGAATLRPDGGSGALVVANHTSWIDVPALCAVTPVTMLAKREVQEWPVIGGLAARVGTVFVERDRLRALPDVVEQTARQLRGGALVGVFPEATTWCGVASGAFRRAPFQAAIDAGVPVRPVSISLRTPDGRPTTGAAFVGEQTLGDSLSRVLRMRRVVCAVVVGDLIDPAGQDRAALARRAAAAVRAPSG